MPKYVVEFTVPPDDRHGMTGIKFEDGGNAAIVYSPLNTVEPGLDPDTWDKEIEGGDGCFFVQLHSWDETAQERDPDFATKHRLFREFMGKKVRVTVETIEE